MTHEYVIATNGLIHALPPVPGDTPPTAIAWAADHVLAVGADTVVRAISRGDSTFLDLEGCVVTALPHEPSHAERLIAEAGADGDVDVGALLVEAGLLDAGAGLCLGSRADLAFWRPHAASGACLVAVVRDGAFTAGDEHRGPFPPPG